MSFLNLVVLRCIDIERTRAFYECLGLQFERHRHGDGPEHLTAVDDWAIVIELYPATERNPADRCGVGLGVANPEKAIMALRSNGFDPGPIEQRPWGPSFVVRDPEGRRVEVKREVSEDDPEVQEELARRLKEHDPS
jgi:lactoylglutathione lyase